MSSSLAAPVAVEYPDSDGKPLAESDFQLDDLTYARDRLRIYYHDQCRRHDVYVAGNLLIYYEEGNRNVSVAPDIFVVFGVPHHKRRSYRLWEEGKVPDFVLEITSHSTWEEDRGKKRELYRWLGFVVCERQANWHMTEGESPLERRSNRSTFPREPCVGTCEGAGEASAAVRAGRVMERRKNTTSGVPRPCTRSKATPVEPSW